MENLLVKLLIAFIVRILQRDLLVREAEKVEDENLGGFLERVLRVNGSIRCYLNDEIIVVGLLLDTSRLNTVTHITDRCVDRIDGKYVDIGAELTVLISGDVATTLVDCEIHLERCLRI